MKTDGRCEWLVPWAETPDVLSGSETGFDSSPANRPRLFIRNSTVQLNYVWLKNLQPDESKQTSEPCRSCLETETKQTRAVKNTVTAIRETQSQVYSHESEVCFTRLCAVEITSAFGTKIAVLVFFMTVTEETGITVWRKNIWCI